MQLLRARRISSTQRAREQEPANKNPGSFRHPRPRHSSSAESSSAGAIGPTKPPHTRGSGCDQSSVKAQWESKLGHQPSFASSSFFSVISNKKRQSLGTS
eukprot:761082-Hanusia_phi.AAC.13